MSERDLRILGAVAAGTGVAALAAAYSIHTALDGRVPLRPMFLADVALGAVWPTLGALIVCYAPRSRMGWLMVASASLGVYQLLGHYAVLSAVAPRSLPGATIAAWVGTWGFAPAYLVVFPLLPFVFPTGRLPGGRWNYAVYGLLGAATLFVAIGMVLSVQIDTSPVVRNPAGVLALTGPWVAVPFALSASVLVGGAALGVACLLHQLRRASGVLRAQLQWLLFGTAVGGVFLVAGRAVAFDRAFLGDALFALALISVPGAITVAILRHGLFDVALVLNRTVAYGALTTLVILAYLALVLVAGQVGTVSMISVLFVAGVALFAAFARDVVQRWIDRSFFGLGRDPYAVVTEVGRHVAAAAEPADALQRLIDGLRGALRRPYAAYVGAATVSSGREVAGWHSIAARALGQPIGELRLGRHRAAERLSGSERAVAEEFASRAATLAYATDLVRDVADSRTTIVAAREEERRRLMADLHDGVGPVLAGTAHQLDALARRLDALPDQALATKAREARDRLRRSVVEVRTLVHGLRPASLDQLGLAQALTELTAGYDEPRCSADLRGDLGSLPAAVEVAGYTIAAEAITNALRHSAASEIHLQARIESAHLVIEVHDNGCGISGQPPTGVGLRSMAERIAEVGGRLDVEQNTDGGTIIRARLPVGSS